jgi:hypothetical protein
MSKVTIINRLRQFVEDWQEVANIEGINLAEMRVSLPCVLYDVAKLLELEPDSILDQNTLEVITG